MTSTPRQKILVIDDDRGPRESLRILLKNDYEVFCAHNVNEGLALLREHGPDLVIMDIRMPEINGIDGLRMIREVDKLVPIMMLTGFGALETAQEALRLGANDYVKKPFDTNEFLRRVADHIKRGLVGRRRAESVKDLHVLNRRLMDDLTERERLASLGQASAELVHDLRNPMTLVYGYVQLLSQGLRQMTEGGGATLAPDNALEYIELVERNVERCNDLIEVWQSLGKKDALRVVPFAVSELLAEVARETQSLADTRRACIEVANGVENCHVLGDRTQISRVLHNLIANAIDAVADDGDGRIRLGVADGGGEVRITVEDNGCGIPPDIQERILDAYFSTKKDRKGTGLGLFITKKIIDDHQGRIEVKSTVGDGSCFSVILPSWDAVCELQSSPNPAMVPSESSHAEGQWDGDTGKGQGGVST